MRRTLQATRLTTLLATLLAGSAALGGCALFQGDGYAVVYQRS